MRFTKLFAAVLCSLAALAASGQNLRDEIAANPGKSGGVYYVYTYDNPVLTPAPKGYKPFYISHYGRHGSRWLLHDSEYGRVKRVYDGGIDRGGDLSPLGAEQHREIAARMYRNFPEVFRSGAVVDAQATLVVRCVLSMAAFCERLKELNPRLEVSRTAGRRTTRYLNFYSKPTNPTLSREYLDFIDKGGWLEEYERIGDRFVRPDRLMSELFADGEFVRTIDGPFLFRRRHAERRSGNFVLRPLYHRRALRAECVRQL